MTEQNQTQNRDDSDDAEGHGIKRTGDDKQDDDKQDDDTEGHSHHRGTDDTKDDDTEGHSRH